MAKTLLSTTDLAEYVQVPVNTIYQWIRTGKGPRRMKVGVHNRFRKEDVDAWLESLAEGGPKGKSAA